MGLGKKEDKRKERGERRGSAMRYCYAAQISNWTDCL
jgi:hypothetical protein